MTMKKIVASVGIIALGVSKLTAGSGALDSSKPWSVSASLRGFYDDNVNTIPSNQQLAPGLHRGTFGFEVNPGAGLNWSAPQTTLSLNYQFTWRYYENKPAFNSDHSDQSQTLGLILDHAFNDRYQLTVRDSFVLGQEPDMLRAGNSPFSTLQRISGDNIVNYGAIDFNGQVTRLVGFAAGYANSIYSYHDSGGNADAPSLAGRLDRLENTIHLDGRYFLSQETILLIGYQFRFVNYTADEEIGVNDNGVVMSDNRNYRQHYVYVGADHNFLPDLSGSVRVGASYIDFYNDPAGNGNGWSPYVLASLRWIYMYGCSAELGISHDMSSTDVVAAQGQGFVASQESTVLYLNVGHLITQKLRGNFNLSFQNSEFNGNGTTAGGLTEQFYLVGLNFEYKFTPHFSATAGYNYDKLQSDIGRTYDRNRVFLGLSAAY